MLLLLYNSLYTRACGKGRKGKGKIDILKAFLKVLPVVLPITREGAKGEIFFFFNCILPPFNDWLMYDLLLLNCITFTITINYVQWINKTTENFLVVQMDGH